MTPGQCCKVLLILVVLSPWASAFASEDSGDFSGEILDMSPESPAPWGLRYISAPLVSVLRGRDYMYAPREVMVETTPAGGYLDLFYVRSGFQKRFEQAEAPLKIILPSRVESGSRDSFTIRAFAEGYRQKSVTFRLSDEIQTVNLDLAPLPNRLDLVSHRYFAGRSMISFLTSEALTFRLQEADDGFGVILTETAISEEALHRIGEIGSPLISEAYSQQLGEDLVVKLVLQGGSSGVEARSSQSLDAPRDLHVFTVDFVAENSAASRVQRSLTALSLLSKFDVGRCALEFDQILRESLDPGSLARALRPGGHFTDRYVRAAMRRLGELSPNGSVEFVDGSRFKPSSSIELEMALGNAAGARGFLALLRSFVANLESTEENQREALRSLLAPELGSEEFAKSVSRARSQENVCLESG